MWDSYSKAQGWAQVVSKRRVQQIVAEAKKGATKGEGPLAEWSPRQDETGREDYLLKLDVLCRAAYGRHLYQYEAKWATWTGYW